MVSKTNPSWQILGICKLTCIDCFTPDFFAWTNMLSVVLNKRLSARSCYAYFTTEPTSERVTHRWKNTRLEYGHQVSTWFYLSGIFCNASTQGWTSTIFRLHTQLLEMQLVPVIEYTVCNYLNFILFLKLRKSWSRRTAVHVRTCNLPSFYSRAAKLLKKNAHNKSRTEEVGYIFCSGWRRTYPFVSRSIFRFVGVARLR